jgi:hypothetical protein
VVDLLGVPPELEAQIRTGEVKGMWPPFATTADDRRAVLCG